MIDRSYETMTSKERFLRTINGEKPDRVPIDYEANWGIDQKLKKYFGLEPHDYQGLSDILGTDFRGVGSPYIGKPLHVSERPDRFVDPQFGIVTKLVEHATGSYVDYCDFPLEFADEETVAEWKFPVADDYDYEAMLEHVKTCGNYATFLGNAGLGCIINTAGFLRGMEQVFVDLITDDAAGLLLIDKFMDSQFKRFEREIDKVHKYIDFVWMGEDLGTQNTPLISMDIFKKHILPRQKPFFDLANSYNKPVLLHTCGSSSWSYDEYIKAGVKGVDTLQPEATNMSPEYLKKTFGGRLFFHGCISTAGPMAFGTEEETVEDCKNILEIMMPDYGYCFSPTHAIQDNSPVENVVAAYKTAHTFGRYK